MVKSYFINKKGFLFLLPWVAVIIYFFIIYRSPLYLVRDGGNTNLNYPNYHFTDSAAGGNSEIKVVKVDKDQFVFKYTLKEGVLHKYAEAGYYFGGATLEDTASSVDLSKYDLICLKIKATHGRRIMVGMFSFIENFTRWDRALSLRHLRYILEITNVLKEYKVPIRSMYTPDWWYSAVNKKENDFGEVNYTKIYGIGFSNCLNIPLNKEDEIDIREVSFKVDLIPFYKYSSLFIVSWYTILFLYLYTKARKRNRLQVEFDHELSNLTDANEKEEEILFNYITSHYTNEELSISHVIENTKIPEKRISTIIKSKTGLNFKQFLNQLRIVEAKRLLLSTNLPISEIAYKTGYSNISHFNRVFKSIENCTPNEIRKGEIVN